MEKQYEEESSTTLLDNKKAWKDPELLELSAETTFGGIENFVEDATSAFS